MNASINLRHGVFEITTGPYDTPVGRQYRTMKAAKQALTILSRHRVPCAECGALTQVTHAEAWDEHCNIESLCFCSDECEAEWSKGRQEEREYLAWATRMGYEPY